MKIVLTPLGPCTKCDAPVYEELRRQRRQFLCFECDATFIAALHRYAVHGSPAACSEECCRGERRGVIEQLLESTVENMCSVCADDDERAVLFGALESMTRGGAARCADGRDDSALARARRPTRWLGEDFELRCRVKAEAFKPDEWLKTLLRVREMQPRRYAREVSVGLQVTVERYAQRKAQAVRRKAA